MERPFFFPQNGEGEKPGGGKRRSSLLSTPSWLGIAANLLAAQLARQMHRKSLQNVGEGWRDLSNLAKVAHFFRLAALVAAVGVDAAKGWRIRVFKSQGCTGPAEPRPDALPAGGYHSDARTPEGRGA
jgi:hypothetical protein